VSSFVYFLFFATLGLSCVVFACAAVEDFRRWKIRNRTVIALVGLYTVTAGIGLSTEAIRAEQLVNPITDLGAGALLFAIGFAMWAVKALGGGDAKLMLPVGLFVGWDYLLPYAIGLVIFAIGSVFLFRTPILYAFGHTRIGLRLLEIRDTKQFPYGVIMVAALYLALYFKYGSALF
jgi:prepilin peptidase CpaA